MVRRLFTVGFLITASFFVAHGLTFWMAERLVTLADLPAPPPAASEPAPRSRMDTGSQISTIIGSGFFPLPTPAQAAALAPLGATAAPAVAAPIDAAKKIKLTGAVLFESMGGLAVVQDLKTQRQSLYRLHDQIPDVAEIVEIQRQGIMLQKGAQREFLELAAPRINQAKAIPAAVPAPMAAPLIPAAVQPASGALLNLPKRVLDRREIAAATADLTKLQTEARAVPVVTDGKIDGWRLESFHSASIFGRFDLHQNDILQRVNGVELKDPTVMLNLLRQVKDEREISVDVLRGAQRLRLTYELR
jgi:general secretion pathway protein C